MKPLKSMLALAGLFVSIGVQAQLFGPSPFAWSDKAEDGKLAITLEVPTGHYVYAAKTKVVMVNSDGTKKAPSITPKTEVHDDELFGPSKVYMGQGRYTWTFTEIPKAPYKVSVEFQGCRDKTGTANALCFPPDSVTFNSSSTPPAPAELPTAVESKNTSQASADQVLKHLNRFEVVATANGVLSPDEFMRFLDRKPGEAPPGFLQDHGILLILLLVLLGGLALNLTPCILPMIPVNLAIIGAGAEAKTKLSGLIRGMVYGAGITLAYGSLGLVTVLTGARFGALDSTWWFNAVIGVVFLVLGLSMFDIYNIDFSSLSSKIGPKGSNGGKLIPVFVLGAIAALLAGACVAPVLIGVIVFASTLYAQGNPAGLLLPFLLGLGMALPWPLAGTGMAVLPKPGKWMVTVKHILGVIIVGVAVYYGGYRVWANLHPSVSPEAQLQKLEQALATSEKSGKPVFIDFWASWCKNCATMEHTTFSNKKVIEHLADFEVVKFQAENLNDDALKPVLNHFNLIGLPTYVVIRLTPKD